MTETEMRIAISEKCGLEDIHHATRNGKRDINGVRLLYLSSATGGERECSDVPNYPEDLNAMHEAEKVFTPQQLGNYWVWLCDICEIPCPVPHACPTDKVIFTLLHSTALQRCTAFCRVFWPERFEGGAK